MAKAALEEAVGKWSNYKSELFWLQFLFDVVLHQEEEETRILHSFDEKAARVVYLNVFLEKMLEKFIASRRASLKEFLDAYKFETI